jgi:hypothetical protein
MKISTNTITILNNFSKINNNLCFRRGNVLRTLANSEHIAAKAKIDETFETEFGIYNLPKFLKALNLYSNPDIQVSDDNTHLIIQEGRYTMKYTLTPIELINAPKDSDISLPSRDICFQFLESDYEKLKDSHRALGLNDFTVSGKDNVISLQVRNKEDPDTDVVSIEVGETDEEFVLNFKFENLIFIPGSYDVIVSKQFLANFTHQSYELDYFVALECDSKFY